MKHKRLLLTRPPTGSDALGGGSDKDPHPQPPLGLAYMAAVLEDKMEVLPILDGNFSEDYLRDLEHVIRSKSPDVIGFSVYTPFANKALEGVRLAKKIDPSVTTVMGGPHVTVLWENTLRKCPELDIIVRDEGEIIIQELMDEKPLKDIHGIAFRDNGGIVSTPRCTYIKDLDTLPYPAYHLLPNFPLGYKPHPPKSGGAVWTSVMWSRGCPFRCTYCTRENSFGQNFRSNSPEYVIGLINYLHSQYGVEDITFYDDVFTMNKTRTLKLLEAMRPENLGFTLNWDCETRVDLVDQELLRAMKRAGCQTIAYGIEHGVWIHEIKGGRATVEQAEKAVRWTHRTGINTIGYFMLGLPNETPETIKKTIEFAKKISVTWAQFAITTPYPGNELYRQATETGRITLDDDWDKFVYASTGKGVKPPLLATSSLSEEDLLYWANRAYKEYYLRARYILQRIFSIRNWLDIKMNYDGFKMLFKMLNT